MPGAGNPGSAVAGPDCGFHGIEFGNEVMIVREPDARLIVHELGHTFGLPHADGMLMVYLPKEKILAYADMFNLPPASDPVPNPPVVGTMVFLDNIERLKLQPEKLLSVHSLNPDRLATMVDIRKSLGKGN